MQFLSSKKYLIISTRGYFDLRSISSNTSSIQRTYLFRKCYETSRRGVNFVPVSGASTTADEYGTKIGEWTWSPFHPKSSLVNESNDVVSTGRKQSKLVSPFNVGLWRPFFADKQTGRIGNGKRFFARLTGSANTLTTQSAPLIHESWRPSQSEDTYDLDEHIVELLSKEAKRLPKPCDPLTYCFWQHGMRRRFEPTPLSGTVPSSNFETIFTICSYNVLCQRTLGHYVEKLYSHCPFEHLTWQRRWPLLAVELQMLDADVFCLQEVQFDHFEQDYMPLLSKLGYDGVFKRKIHQKSDGCATFWRRSKFKPISIYPIEYTLPDPHEHSDSVALITVLESIFDGVGKNKNRLVVANTHLIYQPACGATKLCQAALLLSHLQKITRQYRTPDSNSETIVPLILCGDFNSTPYSPLYSLLIEGQLRYEGLNGWSISGQQQQERPNQYPSQRRLNAIGDAILGSSLLPSGSDCSESCTLIDSQNTKKPVNDGRLEHGLNLRSVYDHTTKDGEREVTTFLRDQPVAVDYIFYSIEEKKINKSSIDQTITMSDVRENNLRCLERYRLPGPTQLNRTIGYLPNQYCASDHLPLMAKFALTKSV